MLQFRNEETRAGHLAAGALGSSALSVCASAPAYAASSHSVASRPAVVHRLVPREPAALRVAETSAPPELERLSFERAVSPWLSSLRRVALRLARSGSEADDLLQETLLRAWRFWPRYTERASCRAWLQRIMSNTFVSSRRRAARERIVLALATPALDLQPAAATEQDQRLDDRMTKSLDALGADQRRVLWLVDVQERSYREAAAELGWPIGTVMSRLHRARAAMRRQLEAAAAPPERGRPVPSHA